MLRKWSGTASRRIFWPIRPKRVLTELTLNRTIALEYDRLRYDHYGRLLAYLFLPDHTLVNAELVRQGLARVYIIAPNLGHREDLLVAQQEAIEAQRGVWQKLLQQDEPYYLGNRNNSAPAPPQVSPGRQNG